MFVFSSNLHHKFKGTHLGRYHFAITGKGWSIIQEHYSDLIPQIVVKGTIFARMSPDQKQQLVQELQKMGYFVGQFVEISNCRLCYLIMALKM